MTADSVPDSVPVPTPDTAAKETERLALQLIRAYFVIGVALNAVGAIWLWVHSHDWTAIGLGLIWAVGVGLVGAAIGIALVVAANRRDRIEGAS